jgi:hypothetical protein
MAFGLIKPPKLKELNHRVALCTMKDVVKSGANMELTRETVTWAWAAIKLSTNMMSFLSPYGYATLEHEYRETHKIIIRAGYGLEITSTAWVYEARLKTAPRWYKSLGFTDLEGWLVMTCHLVERDDTAVPPKEGLRAEPTTGVEL